MLARFRKSIGESRCSFKTPFFQPQNNSPTVILFWIGQNDADVKSRKDHRPPAKAIQAFRGAMDGYLIDMKKFFEGQDHAKAHWIVPIDDCTGKFTYVYSSMVRELQYTFRHDQNHIKLEDPEAYVFEKDHYHLTLQSRKIVTVELVDWYQTRRYFKNKATTVALRP